MPKNATAAEKPDHRAALDTAIGTITKTFGSGSIMRPGDARTALEVKTISSGTISLGAWFQYEGQLIGQGREAASRALAENTDLAGKIRDAVLALKVKQAVLEEPSETPETPEEEIKAKE